MSSVNRVSPTKSEPLQLCPTCGEILWRGEFVSHQLTAHPRVDEVASRVRDRAMIYGIPEAIALILLVIYGLSLHSSLGLTIIALGAPSAEISPRQRAVPLFRLQDEYSAPRLVGSCADAASRIGPIPSPSGVSAPCGGFGGPGFRASSSTYSSSTLR
jgi:hypothetical protein